MKHEKNVRDRGWKRKRKWKCSRCRKHTLPYLAHLSLTIPWPRQWPDHAIWPQNKFKFVHAPSERCSLAHFHSHCHCYLILSVFLFLFFFLSLSPTLRGKNGSTFLFLSLSLSLTVYVSTQSERDSIQSILFAFCDKATEHKLWDSWQYTGIHRCYVSMRAHRGSSLCYGTPKCREREWKFKLDFCGNFSSGVVAGGCARAMGRFELFRSDLNRTFFKI